MSNGLGSIKVSAFPSYILNLLALAGICVALLAAFFFQLVLGEIPCPLCMLQRIGLILVGLGFATNVRFGPSAVNYAVVILSAMTGAGVSLRQVLLHIATGDTGFGSVIFGYHMYTWGFIAFMASIIFSAVMLMIDRNHLGDSAYPVRTALGSVLIGLLLILALGNVASDVLTCGFAPCVGDPQGYIFQR